MINTRAPGPIITMKNSFIYIPIQEQSGTAIRNYGNVGPANFILVNTTGRAFDNEPIWVTARTHSVGNFIRPAVANGFRYECTAITTGITSAGPVTFPTVLGNTVVDGGVTWTCRSLESGNGAVHGAGSETILGDTTADLIHPNSATYDVAGNPLFDMCNFWKDDFQPGKKLLVRFRARTHAMFHAASGYTLNGAVVTFGSSTDKPVWSLTINSNSGRIGLNYVDHAYNPNTDSYGTSGAAHREITGGLLTCDNAWHDVCCYFDAINGDLRTWVDGVEAVINAANKAVIISSFRGYASTQTPPYYINDSKKFANGLSLMSRNSNNTPGARTAEDISTGATSCICNEFLIMSVSNSALLNSAAIELYRSPRGSLPGILSSL